MNGDEILVDARGLRCPWPLLRLARAVRGLESGWRVRLWADDPVAEADVPSFCAEHGWRIVELSDQDMARIWLITG